jgi:curved DNA-binding protein
MADHYATLGVSKNASEKELKTAFRKLAAKHHPDAGGDENKFKEINEAYNTLKDPKKRQMYDQFGTADPQQAQQNPFSTGNFNFTGNPQDFQDIFGSFFVNGMDTPFGQPRRRQNRNISISYSIDFKDVFHGVGNTITYKLPSGKQEVIDVRIPEGVKNGDSVRVQGYGDDSIQGMPRGDLIIKIKVKGLANWRREGDDVYTTEELSVFELILGTQIKLHTPDNRHISINIPAGTNPDTTLSVNGYGTPNVNTGKRGNLYITVKGTTPKLDKNELEEIRKVKNGIDLRTK